jgi:pyruvate/2-oxoglutarate dehydrogenase complex dihydrolipoamide dehydrogenase (E3) component
VRDNGPGIAPEHHEKRRTSGYSICAVGDVRGNPLFAHKATLEGPVAAESFYGTATSIYRSKREKK